MKKTVVAIFEDDLVNRFIYERLFSLKPYLEVHIFENIEAGIAAAKHTPFDVVFVELHFWENFGGIGIMNKLKTISSPEVIYVAMTSLLQQGDLERVLSSGFTMCMEKPIAFCELDFPNLLLRND
jgi:CheY-like chemotaxis protein